MVDAPTSGGPEAPRRKPIYLDFTLLQSAALVFLLDQLTKYLVIQTLAPGMSFPFRGFFRFTHVHNTGSAFGIFQGFNTPLIFVSIIGIIILTMIYRSQERPGNLLRLSLALQLGGAFGNLVDRVRLGFVTDFIDIGPWPVFNIADAAIVSGLFILGWVFTRPMPTHEKPAVPEEGRSYFVGGKRPDPVEAGTQAEGLARSEGEDDGDGEKEPVAALEDDAESPGVEMLKPERTGAD